MMVIPACLQTTGQLTSAGSTPLASPMKVLARTMSRVLTPKMHLGSYTQAFFIDLRGDGDSAVYGVGDDPQDGLGADH